MRVCFIILLSGLWVSIMDVCREEKTCISITQFHPQNKQASRAS